MPDDAEINAALTRVAHAAIEDLEAPPVPSLHHRRAAIHGMPPRPWVFRVGTSNPWSLYVLVPGRDRKADIFCGHLETEELAEMVVEALNAAAMGAGDA